MKFIPSKFKTIFVCLLIIVPLLTTLAHSDEQLHKAAYYGDIEMVKSLLKEQPDPDERDSFGGTALHAAMFQNNLEIVELLIDAGLDVNAQGISNGYTPLHDAVWNNNLGAAKLLVQNGAKIDITSKEGLTPHEKALKEGKTEIAAYLKSLKS